MLHDPNNENSLSGNVVTALCQSSSGYLWAGTAAGLNKIDVTDGEITRFVHDPEEPGSLMPDWIHAICEDSSGSMWIGSEGGLSRLDVETAKFEHFVHNEKDAYSLSNDGVRSLLTDFSGTVWIGTYLGFNRFDRRKRRFRYIDPGSGVLCLLQDRFGALWLGMEERLMYLDPESNQSANFFHDKGKPNSLSSSQIVCSYEDRTGVLWFGTQNGVNRLDREQQRFKRIVHDPQDPNSLSHSHVTAIHEDRSGALWIGTVNGYDVGLDKLDRKSGTFHHSFPGLPETEITSKSWWINRIYHDRFGMLWIATSNGLIRYNSEGRQFTRFMPDENDPNSLKGNKVLNLHEDRTGALWVATYQNGPTRVSRFDRRKGRFDHFNLIPEIAPGQNQGNSVRSISEGQSGMLWFGTDNGIFSWNRQSEEFVSLAPDPDNPNSLGNRPVKAVHEDRNGVLWAAPSFGGLNKFDPETGEFTIYNETDGLPRSSIPV